MYSSLRKIAGFTILLGILNLTAAIVCTLYFAAMPELGPSMVIALNALNYSCAIALLVIGFYLWTLHSDLAAHEDSNFSDLSTIRHRIDKLEKAKD